MLNKRKLNIILAFTLILSLIITLVPRKVSGEVKLIEEMEQKLEGISEEEQAVLNELFAITQKLEEMEREETVITGEIDTLQLQIRNLEIEIDEKQKDYNLQLEVLKKVLVNYQRGGPASYIEILLSADSLSTFLKSINIMKDISHNVNELLVSLEDAKLLLQEEKAQLDENKLLLEQRKVELQVNLHNNQLLQQEKEVYLASLQDDREYYQEQLVNLETIWARCQTLFTDIVVELTNVISSGYFTLEDVNLEFGLFSLKGSVTEDTFHRVLKENLKLPETIFSFEEEQVVITVPELHLILTGDFIMEGEKAIVFEAKEGTFYDMPLEAASMDELFKNGPLLIDFQLFIGSLITIDFTINQVESKDGMLTFVIIPKW